MQRIVRLVLMLGVMLVIGGLGVTRWVAAEREATPEEMRAEVWERGPLLTITSVEGIPVTDRNLVGGPRRGMPRSMLTRLAWVGMTVGGGLVAWGVVMLGRTPRL